jgi:hypothetical protein
MEFLVQLHDVIFFLIGFILGYIVKAVQQKTQIKNLEEIVFGLIIIGVWAYTKIVLQVDDWWLNIFVGLVLAHFFDMKTLKEKLAKVITK